MRPRVARSNAARSDTAQSGAALVLAMLLAALAGSIVAGLLWHQQLWLRQYDFGRDQSQAQSLARSGIDWARLVLNEDARRGNIDHFGEQWAIRLPLTPLENGEIGGDITDQQGLFNLNSLVNGGAVAPEALARYRRLLALLGLPESLGPALVDWLDANGDSTPGGGAEDAFYIALKPPRLAANRPLVTLDELGLVAGYAPEILTRLRPFVTALPPSASGGINVNTAPPEVLAATLDGLALADANRLAAGRVNKPFLTVADFRSRLPSSIPVNELALRVSSDAFIVRVVVRQGEVRATGLALIRREGGGWPRVVWQMIE
ncbi:MAG: type II secretion system minor pseudopilin GspK [Betaproteobacteria bacterium]